MNWQFLKPTLTFEFKPSLILGTLLLTTAFALPVGINRSFANAETTQEVTYEQRLFEIGLKFTLYFEGGFSNHPADLGGRTYRGIIQSEYDAYRQRRGLPPLDVTQMSDAELMEIYQSYWQGSGAGAMNPALAVVMFDTAVNFGINNSITFLQQSLGLPQTGVFDQKTKEALVTGNNINTALQVINERILYRYKRVQENPSQMAFFVGWLNRDYSLWNYVQKIQ